MNLKKLGLFLGIALVGAATLSSCTKSFCTVSDKAQVLYAADKAEGATTVKYGEGVKTQSIVESAKKDGMLTPSVEFNNFIEAKVVEEANRLVNEVYNDEAKYNKDFYTVEYARAVALYTGGEDSNNIGKYKMWYNFDKWTEQAKTEIGLENCPDANYISLYKKTLNSLVTNTRTCISPETRAYSGVVVEGKSWGQAFNYGLIEGLLVYPVAWLLYTFTNAFAVMGGFGTFLAIFLVTLIVRAILIACTFKQTMSQQKMTTLQPELAKIQAKYPNANTNAYEKQKLGQEQMALYKKKGVNPFGMFIVMIFQFPIFIAVWGAMQGSSILMDGNILGLSMAVNTGSALINFKGPWYIAWVIFLLMAIAQFLSMKLPQWLQKKNQKNVQKLGKNPAQEQQAKTMGMVNNVMVIMIIVMGLQLPVAMAIYWFVTALISLGQSLLMQKIANKNNENSKFTKYKTK